MIENYQQQAAAMPEEPPDQSFATVAAVYADGISLKFDGSAAPSAKHYKCNAAIKFEAGQRVRIIKDSGTYVVEYPVGVPLTKLHADTADSSKTAETATTAKTAATANTSLRVTSNEGKSLILSANDNGHFYIWETSIGWKQIDN